MRLSRAFPMMLLAVSAAVAQTPQNWFPPVLENLARTASSKTEFSLDHSMLVLASKADQDDDNLRHIIAGVDGISIHRFRFPGEGMYDPRILSAVRQEYSRAGWQRISGGHDKNGGPGATDLWIHLQNNAIRNIDVLFVGRDQVSFVAVSGSISPIDLMHLAGHFGIPRMQGGVVVPAPGAPAPPPAYGAPSQGSEPPYGGPAPQASEPPYPQSNQPPAAGRSRDSAPPDTTYPDNSAQPDDSVPPPAQSAPSNSDDDYRHPNAPPDAGSGAPRV